MAIPPVFEFTRGETIALALRLKSGSAADVQAVTGRMRRVAPGMNWPAEGEPIAAALAVQFVPAAGQDPAYWLLTAASAALEGDRFAATAWVTFTNGQIEAMDPVVISLAVAV